MKLQNHEICDFQCLKKVKVWMYLKNWFKMCFGNLSDVIIKNRDYKAIKWCFQNWFSSFRSENMMFFDMSFSAQDPVIAIVFKTIWYQKFRKVNFMIHCIFKTIAIKKLN